MLIENKSFGQGDVVIARFPGEEVIGRVAAGSRSAVLRLNKPLRILLQMVNTPQGPAANMTFAPFVVGAGDDATVEIDLSKLVIAPLKAAKDIGEAYRQQTSSILSPDAPLINL